MAPPQVMIQVELKLVKTEASDDTGEISQGKCGDKARRQMTEYILTTNTAFASHLHHWVTDLHIASQNPLLDRATAGDYLILTRRYNHVPSLLLSTLFFHEQSKVILSFIIYDVLVQGGFKVQLQKLTPFNYHAHIM